MHIYDIYGDYLLINLPVLHLRPSSSRKVQSPIILSVSIPLFPRFLRRHSSQESKGEHEPGWSLTSLIELHSDQFCQPFTPSFPPGPPYPTFTSGEETTMRRFPAGGQSQKRMGQVRGPLGQMDVLTGTKGGKSWEEGGRRERCETRRRE